MSDFKVKNEIDSRFDYIKDPHFTTEAGFATIQREHLNAIGGKLPIAGGSSEFHINCGEGVYLDARPKERIAGSFIIGCAYTGATGITKNNLKDKFGGAFMAVNSTKVDAQCTAGKKTLTTNIDNMIPFLMNTMDEDKLATISPFGKSDNSNVFSDTSLSNPLRNGADTINGTETRGVGGRSYIKLTDVKIKNKVGAAAETEVDGVKVDFVIEEMTLAKPFQALADNPSFMPPGFQGILKYRWQQDLHNRLFSIEADDNIAIYEDGTATRQAGINFSEHALILQQYVPLVSKLPSALPNTYIYNSVDIVAVPSNSQVSFNTADVQNNIQFNSQTLDGIPSAFGIASPMPLALNKPRRFLYVVPNQLKITFGQNTDCLAQYKNNEALYELACKNGYNKSFAVFINGDRGNDTYGAQNMVLFSANDMNMNQGNQSNVATNLNLSGSVAVQNTSGENVASSGFVYFYLKYDNVITYDASTNTFDEQRAFVSVAQATMAPTEYTTNEEQFNAIRGGSKFGRRVGNAIKRVWEYMKSPQSLQLRRALGNASKSIRNAPVASQFVGDNTTLGKAMKSVGAGKKGGKVVRGGKKTSARDILSNL